MVRALRPCFSSGAAHTTGEAALIRTRCDPTFGFFSERLARWRTACRLGPPVLWRRRTFDRRIERCAPAVPQHDRARTSAIPLPAHRPCAAASQQSPVAIVPHGDVGCLVGFRREGSAPSTPYMRCLTKWEEEDEGEANSDDPVKSRKHKNADEVQRRKLELRPQNTKKAYGANDYSIGPKKEWFTYCSAKPGETIYGVVMDAKKPVYTQKVSSIPAPPRLCAARVLHI